MRNRITFATWLVAALCATGLWAQTKQEPFTITLRSEKGSSLSASEFDDLAAAVRNFFDLTKTGATSDYHFYVAGGATLPATCDIFQFWIHTAATSGLRLYICEAVDSWVLQGDGQGVQSVSQTAHGFTVAQWVQFDNTTNNWVLLDTDTANPDAVAVGFVDTVPNANTFSVVTNGLVTQTAHGFALGPIYASSTGGTVTTTTPVLGTVEWTVGAAIDSNTILVQQKEWSQL